MATEQRRLLPPPVWFAAAWAVQRAVARHRLSTAASRAAGTLIAAGSGALAISAAATLARAGTELGPTHPERSTVLVTSGPFRFTRNPVYLALAGLLVAHAVWRRSAPALAPAAGFVAVLNRTQIPAEERALQSRFKRAYDGYQAATPRWVGQPKPVDR